MAAMLDKILAIATCGAGTFIPQNGVLNLLTMDARSSYPWPLAWGNALWGYVAYKMYRNGLPKGQRPGFMFGCLITFILYTMPANIFTSLLIFGKTPGALSSSVVLPIHMAACALIELSPAAFGLLSSKYGLAAIDTMGVLDNVTTGFNFVAEMGQLSASPYASVLAGMTTNLGGGIARHFMTKGYTEGAASFDAVFKTNILYSIVLNALYFYFAVAACVPTETLDRKGRVLSVEPASCPVADNLYLVAPILMAIKNLTPLWMPDLKKYTKHKRV